MKKTTILLFTILTLFTTSAIGQSADKLVGKNWRPGQEKTIYGNTILRHEGKNDIAGTTNVGFMTLNQVKQDIEEQADKEMWTTEKKEDKIKEAEEYMAGGKIHLYVERLTIESANLRWFTVIVRDSTDNNEIYRRDLESDVPNTPLGGSDYWWNVGIISIPEKIEGKIYIYIIDKLMSDKFKFEVKL